MEPTSILILGGASAAALSLLENQKKEASHIYKEYDGIPREAMSILETIDRTNNFTGGESRSDYAQFMWNNYDLDKLRWKNMGDINWHAGVHEDVMSSHTFFTPFAQAMKMERGVKYPNDPDNRQLLMNEISKKANFISDYVNSSFEAIDRIKKAAFFMLDNIDYNFDDIIFKEDGSADVNYSCQWRSDNIEIPSEFMDGSKGFSMGIPDFVAAFSALIECSAGEKGVVSYGLIAEMLYKDFFHMFEGHDDQDWQYKYLYRDIKFPKFPPISNENLGSFSNYIPELSAHYEFDLDISLWSGQAEGHPEITSQQLDDLYGIEQLADWIKKNLRPYSKDIFTAWNPDAVNAPLPIYALEEIKSRLPNNQKNNIDQIYPAYPITMYNYCVELAVFVANMDTDAQVQLGVTISDVLENENKRIFPLMDFPEQLPTEATLEAMKERNRINAYRKFFNWYFQHSREFKPNKKITPQTIQEDYHVPGIDFDFPSHDTNMFLEALEHMGEGFKLVGSEIWNGIKSIFE